MLLIRGKLDSLAQAHMRPVLFHDAGNFVTDDGGVRHEVGEVAASDLIVQRINGGGMDAYPDLPTSDDWYGNVGQRESVEVTELTEYDSLHGVGHDLPFLKLK